MISIRITLPSNIDTHTAGVLAARQVRDHWRRTVKMQQARRWIALNIRFLKHPRYPRKVKA